MALLLPLIDRVDEREGSLDVKCGTKLDSHEGLAIRKPHMDVFRWPIQDLRPVFMVMCSVWMVYSQKN